MFRIDPPGLSQLTADDFEVVQLGWGSSPPRPPTNLRIVR